MERKNRSTEIAELAAALAKAQGAFKAAVKDSANIHLKTRYADLASVWGACREALAANGLAVIQDPSFEDGVVTVVTTLLHTSGQWWESILRATPAQGTPQGIGTVITYLRRYGLSSVIGIAPDDDDDANAASASQIAEQMSAPNQAPQPERNDFAPKMLDDALAKIRAMRTAEDCEDLGPKLNAMKWQRAGDRKTASEAFHAKRSEILAASLTPCRGCDVPAGKPHMKGCPENEPKQSGPVGQAGPVGS
jgi:hypothetical protein